MTEKHQLMGGKVHVYRRKNSGFWQCAASVGGRNWRVSTREDGLARAKEFAEDWYLGLRGKKSAGLLTVGRAFDEAAERFTRECEILAEGERSPAYIRSHRDRIRVHLLPFFGGTELSKITSGMVDDYRLHRMTSRVDAVTGEIKRPSRSTLHHEIVTLRQILKTANRQGWIPFVPDMSVRYKASGKVSHRGWFSPTEYRQLYEATRERAKNPKNPRWRHECEQLHDYVLFMANTGLRPDEASRLEFRDVEVVKDVGTGEQILEIEVRGKRGVGYCKSMPGAVRPFERVRTRKSGQGADRVFGPVQRELLNAILDELNLKFDRDGNRRTAYSLRHTYICLRLMEGADIYQIAKNCRTSVEMIEKFYASHLKNTLDAGAINVRKVRPHDAPDEELSHTATKSLRAARIWNK